MMGHWKPSTGSVKSAALDFRLFKFRTCSWAFQIIYSLRETGILNDFSIQSIQSVLLLSARFSINVLNHQVQTPSHHVSGIASIVISLPIISIRQKYSWTKVVTLLWLILFLRRWICSLSCAILSWNKWFVFFVDWKVFTLLLAQQIWPVLISRTNYRFYARFETCRAPVLSARNYYIYCFDDAEWHSDYKIISSKNPELKFSLLACHYDNL